METLVLLHLFCNLALPYQFRDLEVHRGGGGGGEVVDTIGLAVEEGNGSD